MKKLFAILSIALLLSGSAHAWVNTIEGSKNVEVCYVVDMHALTSGDVVVLQTTSPTYWGREVTGTTTAGLPIYGVVLQELSTAAAKAGAFVRVQTKGYTPIVKCVGDLAISANDGLLTSDTVFNAVGSGNSSNTVALESKTESDGDGMIIKAFLR